MDVYLQCLGQEPWKRVVAVCESAAIFLDNSAAELFHWCEKDNVLQRCVGVYSLYHELNPVARDFIFQVNVILYYIESLIYNIVSVCLCLCVLGKN